MRKRPGLASVKSPIWFIFGLITVLVTVGVTAFFILRRPIPIAASDAINTIDGSNIGGRLGTVVESLSRGVFTISYESIIGSKNDIQFQGVNSQLKEFDTAWNMSFPRASKVGGVWTLFGPLNLESTSLDGKILFGKGTIDNNGPALKCDRGIWYGLNPVVWSDLSSQNRGRWFLPAGWYRDQNGKLIVDSGPVNWSANKDEGIRNICANSMCVDLNFQNGHMDDVIITLAGGQVKARVIDLDKNYIYWHGPVSFVRDDGWYGSSVGGYAPRASNGKHLAPIEFNTFQAKRKTVGGTESINADRVLWTKAGLTLNGNVQLAEHSTDDKRVLLQAKTVFQRNDLGGDLPPGMPVGTIWAGPEAVMSWNSKSSISSHHMEGVRKTRQWSIAAPARGRWGNITFTAGGGRGDPTYWIFDGPILANIGDGFIANGNSLAWERRTFTLTGRPVALSRFREKLIGRRLLFHEKVLEFPDGISGTLVTVDEDINIKADYGKVIKTSINLDGRVECSGSNWRLQADSIIVTIGAANMVQQIRGSGSVLLMGRMGEGRGDAILLDPNKKTVDWFGKVKAIVRAYP